MRKRVLIIGAGVIGLSTAYYCARRGMTVTVIERKAAQRVIDIGGVDPGVSRRNRVRTLPQALRAHRPFTLRPSQAGKRSGARIVTMRHETIISVSGKAPGPSRAT